MDSQTFLDKYSPVLKRHWLPLSLGFVGLMFLAYGLIALIGSSNSSKEIIFEAGSDSSLSSEPTLIQDKVGDIVVDVEGAVLKPGVYHMAADSRLSDGLIIAGGLSGTADRDWLAKNLNLAVKLRDGAKIYIPRIGETEAESIKGVKSIKGVDAEDKININSASEEILDSLPGVGPVTAQKVINGRPYSSIDELLSRKIVGSKVFEEVKEKITAY
jgi:competence protein ComEA